MEYWVLYFYIDHIIEDANKGGNNGPFFTILRCLLCIPLDSNLGRSMWQQLALQAERVVQVSAYPQASVNDISFLKVCFSF